MAIQNEHGAMQELGQVLTKQGRLLAFPNVLQHRVPSFTLEDPTKPGHRKILALFLVNPDVNMHSTANVPPQQHVWWAQELLHAQDSTNGLNTLPPELMVQVLKDAEDLPLSMKEAQQVGSDLIKERSHKILQTVNEKIFKRFNFCEHWGSEAVEARTV